MNMLNDPAEGTTIQKITWKITIFQINKEQTQKLIK